MPPTPIFNSLLRVEGALDNLPSPYEKPSDALDVWVLELPTDHQDITAWCVQISEILAAEFDLLHQMRGIGCEITLFIELSARSSILKFQHEFLNLLAGMGISLEIYICEDEAI
jgi:hypothetical protein